MSFIDSAMLPSFFQNTPSLESISTPEKLDEQIAWESNKITALQVTLVIGAIALASISCVAIAYLQVSNPLSLTFAILRGTAIVGVAGAVARVAYPYGSDWIEYTTKEKYNFTLLKDITLPDSVSSDNILLLLREDSTQEAYIKLLCPDEPTPADSEAAKLATAALTAKRDALKEKLEKALPRLEKEFIGTIEPSIQELFKEESFTQLDAKQQYYCALRLCTALYSAGINAEEEVTPTEFDWIPSVEVLLDSEYQIDSAMTAILMLRVAQIVSAVAILGFASLCVVLSTPVTSPYFMLVTMLATVPTVTSTVTIVDSIHVNFIAPRQELIKSLAVFAKYKSSLTEKMGHASKGSVGIAEVRDLATTLKDLYQPATAKPSSSVDATLSTSTPENPPEGWGRWISSLLCKGFAAVFSTIEGVDVNVMIDEKAEITTSLQEKLEAFLERADFKALPIEQKHYWALEFVRKLHANAKGEKQRTQNLHIVAEIQHNQHQMFFYKLNALQEFSEITNPLVAALENDPSRLSIHSSEVDAFKFYRSNSRDVIEPIELWKNPDTKVYEAKKSADGKRLPSETLNNYLERLKEIQTGLNAKITPAQIAEHAASLRVLLNAAAQENGVWCLPPNWSNFNKDNPLDEKNAKLLPLFVIPAFTQAIKDVYSVLLEHSLAISDNAVKDNAIKRLALLIREHSELFAKVVKAKDAQKELDQRNLEVVEQIYNKIYAQITERFNLLKLVLKEEPKYELKIETDFDHQFHKDTAWNAKENRFQGNPGVFGQDTIEGNTLEDRGQQCLETLLQTLEVAIECKVGLYKNDALCFAERSLLVHLAKMSTEDIDHFLLDLIERANKK